jgi:uncharacterized protein (DUF2126 family)
VHTPLVFDIIDRWKERSVGQCIYHAGPPDGGSYATRPANAKDAEGRRRERFKKSRHTLDLMSVPVEEVNPIFPLTLDLRLPVLGQDNYIEERKLTR